MNIDYRYFSLSRLGVRAKGIYKFLFRAYAFSKERPRRTLI